MSLHKILQSKLWEKGDEKVTELHQRLQTSLAALSHNPENDGQRARFGTLTINTVLTELFQSARVIWLMTRGDKGQAETRQLELHRELSARIQKQQETLIKACIAGVPEESGRNIRRSILDQVRPVTGSILKEFLNLQNPLTGKQAQPMAPSSSLSFNPRLKILFLAANPLAYAEPLKFDEEFREIQTAIRKSQLRDQIDLEACLATTAQDFLDALNTHRPKIVHFGGHGTTQSGIVLQGEGDYAEPVGETFLAEIFASLSSDIQLVVLNACYSKRQAESVSSTIAVTVGTDSGIASNTAISFSRALYGALGNGRSIGNAFRQASALLTNIERAEKPTLLCRSHIDPDTLVLTRTAETETYEPLALSLDRYAKDFFQLDSKLMESLKKGEQYFQQLAKHWAPTPPGLFSALGKLAPPFEQEIAKSNTFQRNLEKVGQRWNRHFSDQATGKLTRLEQAVSDHMETFSKQAEAMKKANQRLPKELERPISKEERALLLEQLAACFGELHRYLRLNQRNLGFHYNQFLEFLPAGLLAKGRVRAIDLQDAD